MSVRAVDSVSGFSGEQVASQYFVLLCWTLFGYSVLGKGFAYVGYPPLFVGEAVLAAGLASLVFARALLPAFTTPSNLILLALMGWTALRMAPYFGEYGADALRDGMVVFYGSFALIVTGLTMVQPSCLQALVGNYVWFAKVFPIAGFAAYALSRYFSDHLPVLNGYEVPLIQIRPGEAATHVAGVSVFAIVGLVRLGWVRAALLTGLAIMVISANRGSMLAIVIPIAIAVCLTGQIRQFLAAALFGSVLLIAVLSIEQGVTNFQAAESSDERRVSAIQIVNNASGIVGRGSDGGEGTKEWRQDWWRQIVADTIYGPKFWTGRGFGVNLAEVADVGGWNPGDLPPLRSPHSVHMTLLGRGGVPEVALWGVLLATWFASMARGIVLARRAGREHWRALFLFLSCYILSILIDASFDVALEGPMMGIWFWCLIGFGAGARAAFGAVLDVDNRKALP